MYVLELPDLQDKGMLEQHHLCRLNILELLQALKVFDFVFEKSICVIQ